MGAIGGGFYRNPAYNEQTEFLQKCVFDLHKFFFKDWGTKRTFAPRQDNKELGCIELGVGGLYYFMG